MEAWERTVAKEYKAAIHRIAADLATRQRPEPQDRDWALATQANLADARTRAEATIAPFRRKQRIKPPKKKQPNTPPPSTYARRLTTAHDNRERVLLTLSRRGISCQAVADITGLTYNTTAYHLTALLWERKVTRERINGRSYLWKLR